MLVLSRKPLDSILIGDDIKITIVRIDRNQVRIGIEAPKHIPVLREELRMDVADLDAAPPWDEPVPTASTFRG